MVLACLAGLLSSCNLAGYELQRDAEYKTFLFDPHTNKNVIEFVKSRPDLFLTMKVIIDSTRLESMYLATGNTYVLLTDSAMKSALTYMNTKYRVSGKAWVDLLSIDDALGIPRDQGKIADFLKYHVVKGTFRGSVLSYNMLWGETYATSVPDTCKMGFSLDSYTVDLLIQSNYEWNGKPWLVTQYKARTSDLICTNSEAVQVMDNFIKRPSQYQLGIKQ